MVAGFQEDLDSDDDIGVTSRPAVARAASHDVDLSSEEEGEEEKAIGPIVTADIDIDSDSDDDAPPAVFKTSVSTIESSPSPLSTQKLSDNNSPPPAMHDSVISQQSSRLSDSDIVASGSDRMSPPTRKPNHIADSDEDVANQVAVLGDEDLSDEDTTTSSKPADSGLATDTTQVSHMLI